ncbi:hypothetical protein SD78_3712 [Bacillus badius]|nr:hypothetical protein SD78_3712 [Bacillus badius]
MAAQKSECADRSQSGSFIVRFIYLLLWPASTFSVFQALPGRARQEI